MKNLIGFLAIVIIIAGCTEKSSTYIPRIEGAYLGQKPPGSTPEIFAPNIVSTGFDELFGTFTPNGKEFYYIQAGPPIWTINIIKQENGKWLKPQVAEFSGSYTSKFCLSPDGNEVILTSFRHKEESDEEVIFPTAWIVKRTNQGWTEPSYLEGLDSAFAPSISENKNIYFFKVGEKHQDLYVSKYNNGEYETPVNLGDSINSHQDEADPYIAPDESYILWNSNRENGTGIYISFKRKDGLWTKAKNVGENINSLAPVNVGSVSPDGKYIFLFSNKYHFSDYRYKEITYEEKMRILNSPGNGSIDIYWVDASIIEKQKPKYIE